MPEYCDSMLASPSVMLSRHVGTGARWFQVELQDLDPALRLAGGVLDRELQELHPARRPRASMFAIRDTAIRCWLLSAISRQVLGTGPPSFHAQNPPIAFGR